MGRPKQETKITEGVAKGNNKIVTSPRPVAVPAPQKKWVEIKDNKPENGLENKLDLLINAFTKHLEYVQNKPEVNELTTSECTIIRDMPLEVIFAIKKYLGEVIAKNNYHPANVSDEMRLAQSRFIAIERIIDEKLNNLRW